MDLKKQVYDERLGWYSYEDLIQLVLDYEAMIIALESRIEQHERDY